MKSEEIRRFEEIIIVETDLLNYRIATECRDQIVQNAARLGISKSRIAAISGIARTTIDKILEE